MGFLGFWGSVLRGKSGRWRGANGRFYRGIPGFLGGVRVRRGDSAHGRHCRANWAKKFLKKGRKIEKLGARGAERANLGTLYRTGSVLIDGRTSPHTSPLTYPLPSTTQSNLSVCVHSPRPSTLTLRLKMNLCRILVMTIPIRADRRPLCHRKIHQHPKASPLPQLISLPRTPTRLQIHHVYQ